MRYVSLPLPVVIVSIIWLVITIAIAAYGFTKNLRASLLPPSSADLELPAPSTADSDRPEAFLRNSWLVRVPLTRVLYQH